MKNILDKIILLSKKLTDKSNLLNQIINNNTLSNELFDDIQNNISKIFLTYFPDPYKPRVNIYSDTKVLIDTVYLNTLDNISTFLYQYLTLHNWPKLYEILFININIEQIYDVDFAAYDISKFTFRKVNFESANCTFRNINTIEFILSNLSSLTILNVEDFRCQNSHLINVAIQQSNVLNFYLNALLLACNIYYPNIMNVYSHTVKILESVIHDYSFNNINFYINLQYDTTEMFKNTAFILPIL